MNVRVFPLTRAAPGASADVLVAQGLGHGGATDDALEVVESPGLRARPVVRDSTEALVLELPNGERFAFIVDKGAKDGAVALEAGETQLRGCATAASVVRLRASGDIDVVSAPGRMVRLQGATQPFVRGADLADAADRHADAMQAVGDALAAALTAINAWVGATAVLEAFPATPALHTALTTTLSGALTLFHGATAAWKAERAVYLSSKVRGE